MKKFIFIFLASVLFITSYSNVKATTTDYVNANGIHITDQEYKNLLSMAFNEEDIYLMSQEEFDNNKNNVGLETVTKVSYIKTVATEVPRASTMSNLDSKNNEVEIVYKDYYLTEEEMKEELLKDSLSSGLIKPNASSSSVVSTEYKKLTASITSFLGSEGWMYYRSKADLEWLKMPKATSEDKIRVHVTDGFMSERDTRYGVQIAVKDGKTETVNYNKDSSKWETNKSANEEILKPNLINGSVTKRRIYMYFDAFQYYPDNFDYFRAEAAYNHNTLFGSWDGWIVTTADLKL